MFRFRTDDRPRVVCAHRSFLSVSERLPRGKCKERLTVRWTRDCATACLQAVARFGQEVSGGTHCRRGETGRFQAGRAERDPTRPGFASSSYARSRTRQVRPTLSAHRRHTEPRRAIGRGPDGRKDGTPTRGAWHPLRRGAAPRSAKTSLHPMKVFPVYTH